MPIIGQGDGGAVSEVIRFDASSVSAQWVGTVQEALLKSTQSGAASLASTLPQASACGILDALAKLVKTTPTVVDVVAHSAETTVAVVGDTHGQFHDVCNLFKILGVPSEKNWFVFNGDFVDRGAWGIETLILLACWKLAMPGCITLLRGNHETITCTALYGFKAELQAKYGKQHQAVYKSSKSLFAALPLAAVVGGNTLVLHGGLFRKTPAPPPKRNKRKRKPPARANNGQPLALGSLQDLRASTKGGMDPDSAHAQTAVAADVLWSDPQVEAGLQENAARGLGLLFGPDITERFLEENNLRLVIRSHEGPDARFQRDDGMGTMKEGYSFDHDTPRGRLLTVFSAPDYPQFQELEEGEERYNNLAAVALLRAPSYAEPEMRQFGAQLPRPEATCYYDLALPGSDDEIELCGSATSADTARSTGSAAAESSGRSAGTNGEALADTAAQRSRKLPKLRHEEELASSCLDPSLPEGQEGQEPVVEAPPDSRSHSPVQDPFPPVCGEEEAGTSSHPLAAAFQPQRMEEGVA